MVNGTLIERPLMVLAFGLLGVNIREHHFSTQIDIINAAKKLFGEKKIIRMYGTKGLLGQVYEIGHFVKPPA